MADEAIQGIIDAGLNTAPVIPAAPDPTAPIQGGQNGPAAGSFQPNDGSFQSNFQVQPAHYMQNNPPQQRDFYADPKVREFNFDTGLVTVPHSAQIPFAVLANRQNELDRQKAANDQAIASFNPYAGIGNAAPQYQPAFGKAAREGMNRWFQMVADDRYGGDLKKAYLNTLRDPELNRAFKNQAAQWNDIGVANQDYVKKAQALVTDVYALNKQMSPDKLKTMENYLSAVDDKTGAPIDGTDPSVFIPKMRAAEAVMSQTKYMDKVMTPLAAGAMDKMVKDGKLTYDPTTGKYLMKAEDMGKRTYDPTTGKYLMNIEDISSLKAFRDQFAERAVKQDMIWPDLAAAHKDIDAFFKDRIKFTTKTENPVPRSTSGSGDGAQKYSLGYNYAPISAYPFTSGVLVDTVNISDITGGKGGTADARSFVIDKEGHTANIIPEQFAMQDGELYVVGKDANYKRVDPDAKSPANTFTDMDVVAPGTVKDGWRFLGGTAPDGTEDNDASVKSNWVPVTDKGGPKTVVAPFDLNEGRVSSYWSGLTGSRINSTIEQGRAKRLASGQQQPPEMDFIDPEVQGAIYKYEVVNNVKFTAEDWDSASPEGKEKFLKTYGPPQRAITKIEAELAALPISDRRVQDAVAAATKATGKEYDWTSEPRNTRVAIMQQYGPKY